MIEFLQGTVRRKLPSGLILDCQGVGYGVSMLLSSLVQIPPVGDTFSLWVYTRVREDGIQLYGFLAYEERQAFDVLLQISGVGPKLAIALLSSLDLLYLREIISSKRADLLCVVPGIGMRSAEKIMLELGNRLDRLPMPESKVKLQNTPDDLQRDILSALEHLGFKGREILPVVGKVLEESFEKDFSFLIKKCLSQIVADRRGGVRDG
jgi:Holliday junction DNA helicase RuvA